MIRKVRKEDTPAIAAIYNHYIAHTTTTLSPEILEAL
jgi:L-amino acid N-acyltransferase YncA